MSTSTPADEHPAALAARELVTALVSQGVRDVVLAPGSRSAPLAYALAAAESAGWLQVHVRVDERVAGFLALGIARVRPAAVVTTSGTAVANLHPAVLEAHHSRLPLIVVTADRPHELRDVGASQTTDQVRIFGTAVRDAVDLPAADGVPHGVRAALVRAVAAARGTRGGIPGPVQVNVAFRDPLVPEHPWAPGPSPGPRPRVLDIATTPRPIPLTGTAATVVVAGDAAGEDAAVLADRGGWPLLAEPTSGARHGANAVAGYRRVLAQLGDEVERVVVVGRPTLSRDVSRLLARPGVEVVVIDPLGDWTDAAGTASVVAGAAEVVDRAADESWVDRWRAAGDAAQASLLDGGLSGPAVLHALLGPDQQGTVVLGSSMTVRHADLAAPVGPAFTRARVVANRGLAGIDGTVSTATGLALATGAPVRVVVGDLTFLHDVGGLARGVHEPEVDLQVIVLDDGGGSIFATLEHGRPEHADVYPRFFGTPQHLDLAALAAGFGADDHEITSQRALADLLAAPIRGRSVVRVPLR